ncbi:MULTISPECIES: hypothetical protein [unclassified Methylococcus]|uniref:hypothetical protein n=1 Tax=unclassified Methylococcus TaxID=2618889 RepID=UPI003D7DDDBF
MGGIEVTGLKNLGDMVVEAFQQTMGLGMAGRDQTVFDRVVGAGLVKQVGPSGVLGLDEQSVGELRTVAGQALMDAEGCDPDQSLIEKMLASPGAVISLNSDQQHQYPQHEPAYRG